MSRVIVYQGLILAILMSVYGCSDENAQFKGEYLAACLQAGMSKKVCRCAYDKTEANYSIADIRRFTLSDYDHNSLAKQYMQDTFTFMQSCYASYH